MVHAKDRDYTRAFIKRLVIKRKLYGDEIRGMRIDMVYLSRQEFPCIERDAIPVYRLIAPYFLHKVGRKIIDLMYERK